MHCRGMRAAQLEFGLTAKWLSVHHGNTAIVQHTDTIAPVQQVAELACSGFNDILPRVSNYGQSVSNATRNQTIKTVVQESAVSQWSERGQPRPAYLMSLSLYSCPCASSSLPIYTPPSR